MALTLKSTLVWFFHWVFGPNFFSIAAVGCFATGVSMALSTDPKDIYAAKWLFGIAAFLAAGRAGHWIVTGGDLPFPKPVLAVILFGSIGGLWAWAHIWAQRKADAVQGTSALKLSFMVESVETKEWRPKEKASARFFAKDYISDPKTGGRPALSLIPIDVIMALRLINTSSTPVNVESYEIRVQKDDGSWTRLCRIGAAEDIYATDETRLSESEKVDLQRSGFDRLMKFKTLKQNDPPLRGFAFFTYSERKVLENQDIIWKRKGGGNIEMKVFTSDGHTIEATSARMARLDDSFIMEMSGFEDLSAARIAPRFWWCSSN